LHLLNKLLPEDLRFGVRVYVIGGRNYDIAAYGEDAARLMRLLAVAAPSASGEYLSPKFEGFVGEAQVAVRLDEGSIRRTKRGRVAADLTISEGGVDVKYSVYLYHEIVLRFDSADRSRAELAARLLKLAGVDAEVKKAGNRDVWQVWATTDMLAAGRKELRDAIADIVRKAAKSGWVDAGRAERWLDKLEKGLTLREGWPKYEVGLARSGALVVRYRSTNPEGIEREVQRLRAMGLVEGRHFAVKMPEGGRMGYVSILREGLERAAWLSVHGSEEQRELAAKFVEYILQRAREEGKEVHEKALEIVERGREVASLRLEGFEKVVDGRLVKVIGGGAQSEGGGSGRKLLRIQITAEIGGVRSDYEVTYGRYGKGNKALGRAYARADAPGGREADAERLSALIKALTDKEPRVYRVGNKIVAECGREHLNGFARYAELTDAIERWLGETGRRRG